jgi:hypothetical protein
MRALRNDADCDRAVRDRATHNPACRGKLRSLSAISLKISAAENHYHERPNGSTKSATIAYAIRSTHSKPKPSERASAKKSMIRTFSYHVVDSISLLTFGP